MYYETEASKGSGTFLKHYFQEDTIMSCFNFGGGNCCWIIILILILFCGCGNGCGGCDNGCGGGCGNNGCGC